MKTLRKVLVLMIISLMFFRCSQEVPETTSPGPSPSPSAPSPSPSPTPSFVPPLIPNPVYYSIHFISECSYGFSNRCLGGFGFSIQSNGTFVVGPGPQREILMGHLEPEEFKPIEEFVITQQFIAHVKGGAETCVGPFPTNTVMDLVNIYRRGKRYKVVQVIDSRFCYRVPSSLDALRFYYQIKSLVAKYYPLPFPY